MVLQDVQIIFDKPQNIYYCGETVSGRLVFVAEVPKVTRSIIIRLKGEAHVYWTEKHTEEHFGKREDRTYRYKNEEIYFQNNIKVFGSGIDTETLQPGEYCYRFSMLLPDNLPTSYETEFGYIRYTVKALIDCPPHYIEAKRAFTVLQHLDLNLDPHNRLPVKMERHKTFCCCWCESGPLTLVAMIPATGYVPGQRIPVIVEVDNASNVDLFRVVVELQKFVTLYGIHQQHIIPKQYHLTISELELEGSVLKNDSKTWSAYFTIPPLPPSKLRRCTIIDLDYKLKVKAKPLGFHNDLTMEIPINIGTIPLTEAQPLPVGLKTASALEEDSSTPLLEPLPQPSAPPPDAEGISASMSYPDIPPPSYEECMFGVSSIRDAEDGQDILGIASFSPRYPTYNLPDAPPSYPGWTAPPPSDPPPKK